MLHPDNVYYPHLQRIKQRYYQLESVAKLRDMIRRGLKKLLLQGETGSGKTATAAEILRLAWETGTPSLFIVHRRELVKQTCDTLEAHSVPHGIIQARKPRTDQLIQVCSKDTLISRLIRNPTMARPAARLIIPDEAHLTMSAKWQQLLALWPDAVVIGLTATPARADGRGLGDYYQGLHCIVPPSVLIREGYIVPCRVLAPHIPDLKGVRVRKGEYVASDAEGKMNVPKLVANIVETWLRVARERGTIVFASGIDHSKALDEAFRKAGVRCRHLDGTTEDEERAETIEMLQDGTLEVVTNVGVLPEGFDAPRVSCAVLARPTKSFTLYRQMCGRTKRPFTGKVDALILDHAGAVFEHQHPDIDFNWALTTSEKAFEPASDDGKPPPTPVRCPACFFVFSGSQFCPQCHEKLPEKIHEPRNRASKAGHMLQVDQAAIEKLHSPDFKIKQWHRFMAICAWGNKPAKIAAGMYRKKFGCFPEDFLPNRPRNHEWQQSVAVLFPNYLDPKAARMARDAERSGIQEPEGVN